MYTQIPYFVSETAILRGVKTVRAACVLALWITPLAARAGGVIVPDPQGVFVDAEGMLCTRTVEAGLRLDRIRAAARDRNAGLDFICVSLPRLFAEVRARIERGEVVPDELRYLSGLTRVRYVFVFPDDGNVVLAGPAEPIVADFPGRPLGGVTGRPVLQLDDLVVALRTCGPGREGNAFGCSIDLTAEATERMFARMRELRDMIRREPDRRAEVAQEMAHAAGPMEVRFFGIEGGSRLAFVMVEADYLLKRHALRLDPTPVARARSYLERVRQPGRAAHRFWFELDVEAIRTTPGRDAFELAGRSLKVSTRRSFAEEEEEPAREAAEYARDLTREFGAISEWILAWADLENVADLAIVAALIARERLAERAGWDLGWVLERYPVGGVDTPRRAPPLVNYHVPGGAVIYLGGGVRIAPARAVETLAEDASLGRRAGALAPPATGWRWREGQ
jgi:hypothetical protein